MRVPTRRESFTSGVALIVCAFLPQAWRRDVYRHLHGLIERSMHDER